MGTPSAGSVVLAPFPFSDLTDAKLRPALVIASVDRDDWILCQITSNPYGDSRAIRISEADFESGSLRRISFVRPGKLFTGNQMLIQGIAGQLTPAKFVEVVETIVAIIRNDSWTTELRP